MKAEQHRHMIERGRGGVCDFHWNFFVWPLGGEQLVVRDI